MLAAEHCAELVPEIGLPKHELLEIHRSKISLHHAKQVTVIQQAFSMVFSSFILIVYLELEIDTRYERKRPISFRA